MDGRVSGQLRMEGGHQDGALAGQHRLVAVAGQRLHRRPDSPDTRSADEHHLDRHRRPVQGGQAGRLERFPLAAVRVALDGDVDEPQGELAGALDVAGENDQPGAGAEQGPAFGVELLERRREVPFLHEVQQRGRLASGDDEAVDVGQLLGLAHLDRLHPAPGESRPVQGEIPLEGEDADAQAAARRGCHHPRVCNSSLAASLEVSIPGMASPSSSLTRASTSASLKWVVACTMAFARRAGSLDLKMPDPTKTASAPSCIIKAASAGVAIPPAEKLGTGSLPAWATQRTRSYGAPRVLASVMSSSGPSVVSRRTPPITARMWRPASTILPAPASPLVRIRAAPSPMRRSASPRSRAPHTNGIRKANLSM